MTPPTNHCDVNIIQAKYDTFPAPVSVGLKPSLALGVFPPVVAQPENRNGTEPWNSGTLPAVRFQSWVSIVPLRWLVTSGDSVRLNFPSIYCTQQKSSARTDLQPSQNLRLKHPISFHSAPLP